MEGTTKAQQPHIRFEIEKIIGVSIGTGNMRSYHVQYAPVWVSGMHLVGCEHLIQDFLFSMKGTGGTVDSATPMSSSDKQNSTDHTLSVDDTLLLPCSESYQRTDASVPKLGDNSQDTLEDTTDVNDTFNTTETSDQLSGVVHEERTMVKTEDAVLIYDTDSDESLHEANTMALHQLPPSYIESYSDPFNEYPSSSSYNPQQQYETNRKTYICHHCNLGFSDRTELKRHTRQQHVNEGFPYLPQKKKKVSQKNFPPPQVQPSQEVEAKVMADEVFHGMDAIKQTAVIKILQRERTDRVYLGKDLLDELYDRTELANGSVSGSACKHKLDEIRMNFIKKIIFWSLPAENEEECEIAWHTITSSFDVKCRGIKRYDRVAGMKKSIESTSVFEGL